MKSSCAIIILSGWLVACASAPSETFLRFDSGPLDSAAIDNIQIDIQPAAPVRFLGEYDYDDVNAEGGNFGYPADTGAMFLASLITHAVAVEAIKAGEMSAVQEQANEVLEPYQPHLARYDNGTLLQSVLGAIDRQYAFAMEPHIADQQVRAPLLVSEPVFFMTQDEQQLILKHAITLYADSTQKTVTHRNIVEVISPSYSVPFPYEYWVDENNLPFTAGQLYGYSLKLFLDDVLGIHDSDDAIEQTFRYTSAGENTYERGTLLANSCNRITIRTLRGWLKSFVQSEDSVTTATADCEYNSYVDSQRVMNLSGDEAIQPVDF